MIRRAALALLAIALGACEPPAHAGNRTPTGIGQPIVDSPLAYAITGHLGCPTCTAGSITLAGDVTGASGATTVGKIQGRTVAATAPTDTYYLGWNAGGSRWEPKAIPATGVTQVNTGAGLTGGPITTTGTASLDLAHQNTFTKAQNVASFALTDGATINTDASQANAFTVTLGGNRTLANPTNLVSGGSYLWEITQDGTGSRTLAYGGNFSWSNGVAPVLATTAAAVDVISCLFTGSKLRCVFNGNFL